MSILSQHPVIDSVVAECGLAQFITRNVWGHKKPYMGFTEDTGVTELRLARGSLMWKADMLEVSGSILTINKKRSVITGEFNWDVYGVDTITSMGVLIFEDVRNALPYTIDARIIYLNDCYNNFGNHYLDAFSIVFTKWWRNSPGCMHDVDLNCSTLSFNDPPKKFENITGNCEKIIFRCDDLDDVPGLCAGLIKQTLNGKKITKLKDFRAYVNNPKKYPQVDSEAFFDVQAFIDSAGLNKLKGLSTITIMDHGVRMDFNKPTDEWMCTHIERL